MCFLRFGYRPLLRSLKARRLLSRLQILRVKGNASSKAKKDRLEYLTLDVERISEVLPTIETIVGEPLNVARQELAFSRLDLDEQHRMATYAKRTFWVTTAVLLSGAVSLIVKR